MVGFLQKIYQSLDDNSNEKNVAFLIDFSKVLSKVRHFELIKKIADIRVGGCLPQDVERNQW